MIHWSLVVIASPANAGRGGSGAGGRKGQHSIRIDGQSRICFIWSDSGPQNIEIVDYH
jgi:plasmid maintenance system killer protein